MSKPIEQVYATHCTNATAVFSNGGRDQSGGVYGYSARAGSISLGTFESWYREAVEPILFRGFEAPRDVAASDKADLTVDDVPARLFYYPSWNGYHVLGQLSYRSRDVRERAGSYFGHFVLTPEIEGETAWSALECLRLWEAPGWVKEDRPGQFDVRKLSSIDELLQGERPAIDDSLLLRFVTAPQIEDGDDPHSLIPEEHRSSTVVERNHLISLLLRGFLQRKPPATRLLLVADPEFAAFLFYAAL